MTKPKTTPKKLFFLICPASHDVILLDADDVNNADLINDIILDKMSAEYDDVYLVEVTKKFQHKYVSVPLEKDSQ